MGASWYEAAGPNSRTLVTTFISFLHCRLAMRRADQHVGTLNNTRACIAFFHVTSSQPKLHRAELALASSPGRTFLLDSR